MIELEAVYCSKFNIRNKMAFGRVKDWQLPRRHCLSDCKARLAPVSLTHSNSLICCWQDPTRVELTPLPFFYVQEFEYRRSSPEIRTRINHLTKRRQLIQAGNPRLTKNITKKDLMQDWVQYTPHLIKDLISPLGSIMSAPDIDLIILDFDGVLTDNRVYIMEDGREAVACHRGDGWGIGILSQAGIEVMILSTESNPVVSARATKLGIECLQNCDDKASTTSGIIKRKRVSPSRVMYVGNDTNDASAMVLVGHPAAPADAHPSILKIAKTVTKAKGGHGVVREIADLLVSQEEA